MPRSCMLLHLLALLPVFLLSGCVLSAPGHLYPVQGPRAAQTPVPTYPLRVTLVMVPLTGTVSATLDSGEVCQGSLEKIPLDDPSSRSMQDDWDLVYGPGFFVSQILGKKRPRATLIGTHGTHLNVEMFNPALYSGSPGGSLHSIIGVARDDQGTVYKVTF